MSRITSLTIGGQLGESGPCRIYDFSRPRRELSNAAALGRVAWFLRTGNPRHLPPELRPEAEGIRALCLAAAASGPPDRLQGADIGEVLRALAGELADEPSGLLDDDGPDEAA